MTMNADFTQVTAGLSNLMSISNQLASAEFSERVTRGWDPLYMSPEVARLQNLYSIGLKSAKQGSAGVTAPAAFGVGSVSVEQLNINDRGRLAVDRT